MSSYIEHIMEHVRLAILRHLNEAPAYSANDSFLYGLVNRLGLTATRDQIRTALTWLSQQGLVETETIASVMVATITQSGIEVAAGRSIVPGIQRPSPGA